MIKINIKSILIFLLISNLSDSIYNRDISEKDVELKVAFCKLTKIGLFAFGNIGYASHISDGEKYFNIIYYRTNPEKLFVKIFKMGNIHSKCYALVALQKLNKKKFATFSKFLLKNKKHQVCMMNGDIVYYKPVSQIVADIEQGNYLSFLSKKRL